MRASSQPLPVPPAAALLQALLDASHTGLVYLRPVLATGHPAEIADFAFGHPYVASTSGCPGA